MRFQLVLNSTQFHTITWQNHHRWVGDGWLSALTAWKALSQLRDLQAVQKRTRTGRAPRWRTFSSRGNKKHTMQSSVFNTFNRSQFNKQRFKKRNTSVPVRCAKAPAAAWGGRGFFSVMKVRDLPGNIPVRLCSSHPGLQSPDSWWRRDECNWEQRCTLHAKKIICHRCESYLQKVSVDGFLFGAEHLIKNGFSLKSI